MTIDETTEKRSTWETYASAWKVTDDEAKGKALSASVSPACVYRDPITELSGHPALVAHMHAFHAQSPGAYFRTKYFLAHHGRSIARWDMVIEDAATAEPKILAEGISYGEYDAQGRLAAMTGFFEAAPST